ncbi:hypothetical protein [Pareuzebyella sediminis]|uniref:hypothetical protein n=1 Tax=Pareuzebyella sediminis TaxID=2607998 RepID=UPI001E315E24|nr:hypothetical protein [Pareuzebyella sediminis]
MMKYFLLLVLFSYISIITAQKDERVTSIEFVQVLNDNEEEAIYYFQNNWKALREMALERGFIDSFQVLEAPANIGEEESFQLMLFTTYANKAQYALREKRFQELIREKGTLELLNDKKPEEFRKSLFTKEMVRHWN